MKFLVWLTIKLLKSKRITGEQKTRIIAALLRNIHAVPIQDVISFNEDRTMSIEGRKLDVEQAMQLNESANGLKNSYARRVINAQLTYKAIQIGLHQGMNPEQIQFSKAILWIIQEENDLINAISTE